MARVIQALKLGLGLWLAAVMVAMFVWVPPHAGLGNLGRIIIVHVPTAWVTTLAFLLSAVWSALYLRRGRAQDDDRAVAAAEGGLLFAILATVTGSIFAKVVWGSFWNWDPRETSIFVLLLIYAAYFALRSAVEDEQRRRRLAAVYALLAFVTVPFLIFVIPRVAESTLHPNCALLSGSKCDGVTLSAPGSGGKVIAALGDQTLELLALEQRGDEVVALVEVTSTGAASKTRLSPSFSKASGQPLATPNFPGTRFGLLAERAADGQVRFNIEQPESTGLLVDPRTLWTFLASIVGFTGLFYWLYRVRSALLGIQGRLQEVQG